MAKKITLEEMSLYRRLLVGFSVGQYVLAMVYYIYRMVNVPAILTLIGVCVAGVLLSQFAPWKYRAVRIVTRVIYTLVFLVGAILMPLTLLLSLSLRVYGDYWSMTVTGMMSMMQWVFLSLYPLLVAAAFKGKKWDVISLRVLSVAECITAVVMGILSYQYGYISMNIANDYFNVFYVLCIAATTALVFIVHPIHLPFLKKKGQTDEPEDKPEEEPVKEEAASEPAEERPAIGRIFRDLGDEKPLPPEKPKRAKKRTAKDKTAEK